MNEELDLLLQVEREARALREPCGYESGASSEGLNQALKALDEWRALQRQKLSVCVTCGYPEVAHGRIVWACSKFKKE